MLPFQKIQGDHSFFREVRIVDIIRETADTKTFVLEPMEGWLPYRPGQFLTFAFPGKETTERRSYSISSAGREPLSVTVKRIPNGLFSRPLLEHGEIGDHLTLAGGASGFFTLPESDPKINRILFLAAGSGITPVFSLIKSCLAEHPEWTVVLIYSNHAPEQTIFLKSLQSLHEQYSDRFHIEWLYSSNQDLMRARLNKLVLTSFVNQFLPVKEEAMVYLCGPFDYMRMAAIVLQAEGIPPGNIKREIFSLEKPVSPARPPDTLAHRVTIHIRGEEHTLTLQYPETILQAARKRRIELPYSCEAGRCGSCVASCTQGKVWMKYNEVLTDRDVESGRALICNAYPIGGDAVIRFDE